MSDLKPCPFCGGKAQTGWCDFDSGVIFISCDECGMYCEPKDCYANEPKAIAAWNARATLGSGTCEMLPLEPGEYATNAVRCSECGAIAATFDDAHECCEILFCPNCGKAVSA